MSRALAWFLLLICAAPALQAASFTQDDLQRQAEAFAQTLSQPPTPSPAATAATERAQLLRWADEFDQAQECAAAFALRKKALQLGQRRDSAAWSALGRSAVCANRFAEASQAFFLALEQAPNQAARLELWDQLGAALERRHDWQNDWKSLASAYYRLILLAQENPEIRARLQRIQGEQPALLLTDVQAEEQASGLSLCLRFNQWLNSEGVGDTNYRDYVRFEPEIAGDLLLRDGRLCASGAAFGTAYKISLLQGLPYAALRLEKDQQTQLEPVQRQPKLWFKASAYVLPQANGGLLPLSSVNLAKVQLQLYRIHERNLLSPFVQEQFRRRLDRQGLAQLEDQIGAQIWQGEQTLQHQPNRISDSSLQLPQQLLQQPGLYLLQALDPELLQQDYWEDEAAYASQWLVVSDIGLTSYLGQGGLTLQARSLASGKPLAGVKLSLKARNNRILAEQTSDAQGLARFDPGLLQGKAGEQAQQVVALAAGHGFSLLDLNKALIDLSDRGVDGRAFPGPLDAFVYTEQGIYRPGAQVNAVGLLRDASGRQVAPLPLTLRLLNPQGEPLLERVLEPSAQAAYHASLELPANARTGKWRVLLQADAQAPPLGETSFLVEAIAPPRIEAKVELAGQMTPDQPAQARLQANYLYGPA
ncbi:MAG: hypothetical protein HQL47_11040, partial [Gammaproteobacteria bacterium]|nr:hypothetical protein [Gammaproteobacteria bacterium]